MIFGRSGLKMNLNLYIVTAIILIYVDQILAHVNHDVHNNPDDSRDEDDDDDDIHKSHGWAYKGPQGPENWPAYNSNCKGSHQSPINIVSRETRFDKQLQGIMFEGYDIVPPPNSVSINNNGHTISMQISENINISIIDGGLKNKYKFAQLHFHWGHKDAGEQGSEHTIDGRKFSMELHLVHYQDKYDSLQEAAAEKDGLAVIGVLITLGPRVHPGMENIVQDLHRVMFKDENINLRATFPLKVLLPPNTKHYYRYTGSLTTPNCYESVQWTILSEPIQISKIQMHEFLEIRESHLGKEATALLKNNYRPPQMLNQRTIYRSNQATMFRSQIQDLIIMTASFLILMNLL